MWYSKGLAGLFGLSRYHTHSQGIEISLTTQSKQDEQTNIKNHKERVISIYSGRPI